MLRDVEVGAQVLKPGEGLARSQSIDGEADCALLIVTPLDFGDSCVFWFLDDRQEANFFFWPPVGTGAHAHLLCWPRRVCFLGVV